MSLIVSEERERGKRKGEEERKTLYVVFVLAVAKTRMNVFWWNVSI